MKASPIQRQRQPTLAQMLAEIPSDCDRGTKCNAQGCKISWNVYKLPLDTADCGVPITALLCSASMHDSLAAISLSLLSAERVANLYDVMDAAYCSADLREHSRSLGHVPLIDHNPAAVRISSSHRPTPFATRSAPLPSAAMRDSRMNSAARTSWSRAAAK